MHVACDGLSSVHSERLVQEEPSLLPMRAGSWNGHRSDNVHNLTPLTTTLTERSSVQSNLPSIHGWERRRRRIQAEFESGPRQHGCGIGLEAIPLFMDHVVCNVVADRLHIPRGKEPKVEPRSKLSVPERCQLVVTAADKKQQRTPCTTPVRLTTHARGTVKSLISSSVNV
jgi:hypothetical protein